MYDMIPTSAKKVFSGVRFDVYQWQQELYDGSFATFERARFQDGAFTVAVLPNGEILITKQEQPARNEPFISLPGGGFDSPDEDPVNCAKRELLEETGYESGEWELWRISRGTANIVTTTYFYIARNCHPSIEHFNIDAGEKIEVYTVDFDGFLDLALDERFHHWTILPYLFRAKLDKKEYDALKKRLLGG